MKNDILKIIFVLKNRKKYVERYLNLLTYYNKNHLVFDILIITDHKENFFKLSPDLKYKVILKQSGLKRPISGINDIFRSILINSKILEKYKYLIFVEDDNFVFPDAILKCKKFMKKNLDFISSNGKSFLFSKNKKFKFANLYNLPNSLQNKKLLIRVKKYNGGIFYYSLFKKIIFIRIIKNIIKIKDNNLSEIFFNFQAIKLGKHKKLNNIFLAREYPRPKIYNIPKIFKWIQNANLLKEIKIMSKILTENMTKKNEIKFLSFTIYKYLFERLENIRRKKIKFFLNNLNKNNVYYIKSFIKYLNK